MHSALGQETRCFHTPKENSGKSLSGSLTPQTKITTRTLGVGRNPSNIPKLAPIGASKRSMTQGVSSMGAASASCSGVRTERSHILRRITGGQPTITRFLGKMSVIPSRIQTQMPDRCMEGRLEKGTRPPPEEPKIPGGSSGSQVMGNRTPSGTSGQPGGQKNTNGAPGGGNRNPGHTPRSGGNKGNGQGSQCNGKRKLSGASSSGKGKGGGGGGGPSSSGCGREGAIIMSIRFPVQIRCQMQTEFTLKMP